MLYTEVLEALESDEHLEHFGIKGMHWGSRRASNSNTGSDSKQHTPMSGQTKKKIATTVGAVALGGLSAVVLGKHLKQIKQDKELLDRSQRLADDIFSKYGTSSLSDLNASRKEFGLPTLFN